MKRKPRSVESLIVWRKSRSARYSGPERFSETGGFMKTLIDAGSDRILGFSVFGVEAAEILATMQVAMLAGLVFGRARTRGPRLWQ
jgi:pyruvate/2-oxoglutarate dehydrogenase complex dihydrolipoamide dehydrogenase (E3) component